MEAALDAVTHGYAPEEVTIVHGAAKGADMLAHVYALKRGFAPEPHPADWKQHGKGAGPIRNEEMVALGADLCVAFRLPESIGTVDCIIRAKNAGIPVEVHGTPEG